MLKRINGILSAKTAGAQPSRWEKALSNLGEMDLSALRALRDDARAARIDADRTMGMAQARILESGAQPNLPAHVDWIFRPDYWRGPATPSGQTYVETQTSIADDLTVFHDCPRAELTVRQVRNLNDYGDAAFALSLDVLRFEGSFMSVVLDLPEGATKGLRHSHIIAVQMDLTQERQAEMFARLNVQHGPNQEQLVREIPIGETHPSVEFDLAYTKMNEKRVERMWIDFIFDRPAMNRIVIQDLTVLRRPRAEL